MEILPQSFLSSSNCFLGEVIKGARWTAAENKVFENALAVFDRDTPDRWLKVASLIPGKTAADVLRQYRELVDDIGSIEAGLFPIPSYDASPFTLELVDGHGFEGLKHGYGHCGKRSSSARSDMERKKGVPWTEEEHKLFLLGLKKYGKGDWRNISRNYVVSRTPTQVASHAQKYFIRQLSGGKDKRRASIHDITTVDPQTASLENKLQPQSDQSTSAPMPPLPWSQPSGNGAPSMAFNAPANANVFSSSPYGIDPFGFKMQGQNYHKGGVHESYIGPQGAVFQLQSRQHYPCG